MQCLSAESQNKLQLNVVQYPHVLVHHFKNEKAQLLQRNQATRYVSKFMLCSTSYGSSKSFKQQK